ncbi:MULTISPECIES: hypothetical protein [unclassified Arthrobacter]|uniref:hypothetical protein n=1 Tax=unclassified Arthrobacter TaxID=235627 RepID=UPI002882F998|nr:MULTISPECIES: hypothetical protein [unclassified Arthrobacter]
MSVKTRRSLLIFVFGFGTYALLVRPLGFVYAMLIGFVVVAVVLSVDQLVQSKRENRTGTRDSQDPERR